MRPVTHHILIRTLFHDPKSIYGMDASIIYKIAVCKGNFLFRPHHQVQFRLQNPSQTVWRLRSRGLRVNSKFYANHSETSVLNYLDEGPKVQHVERKGPAVCTLRSIEAAVTGLFCPQYLF